MSTPTLGPVLRRFTLGDYKVLIMGIKIGGRLGRSPYLIYRLIPIKEA